MSDVRSGAARQVRQGRRRAADRAQASSQGRIGITAADRTGPEFMGVQAWRDLQEQLMPEAKFVFLPEPAARADLPQESRRAARDGEGRPARDQGARSGARRPRGPGVREYQLAAAVANAVMNEGGRYHLLMIGSTSMHDPKLIFPNPNPSAPRAEGGRHHPVRAGDVVHGLLGQDRAPVSHRPADGEVQHVLQGRRGAAASRRSAAQLKPGTHAGGRAQGRRAGVPQARRAVAPDHHARPRSDHLGAVHPRRPRAHGAVRHRRCSRA